MPGLLSADKMDPQVGQSPHGTSFSLCYNFCRFLSFEQEHYWAKNFEIGGWHLPLTYLLVVVSTGSVSTFLCILAIVISFGSWEPLSSLASVTLQCSAFIEC